MGGEKIIISAIPDAAIELEGQLSTGRTERRIPVKENAVECVYMYIETGAKRRTS